MALRRAMNETMQRVLMVPPRHFTVKYAINPWMKKDVAVDRQKAMQEWNALKASIEAEGVKVLTVDQVEGLPDMVFCCNSGLVHGNKVFLSRYKHAERTGEQKHFADFYKKFGFQLFGTNYPEYFEGGGDAIFSDQRTLWAGWGGPRTSKKAYDHIQSMLCDGRTTNGEKIEIVYCELVDPRFYHLDTCLCPIGVDSALWFPPAFSSQTCTQIQNRLPRAIAVSEKEAQKFVCNAICIRRKVISPEGMEPSTREALAKLGYSVVDLDMDEFMKSGGACQCLVMRL